MFTHPQEVSRVEILIPQVVDAVKPNEKEDVDAHPDHLQKCFKKDFLLKMQNRLEAFYAQTLCVKPQLLRFVKSHSRSEELTSMKAVSPWLIIQLPMFHTSTRFQESLHPQAVHKLPNFYLAASAPNSSHLPAGEIQVEVIEAGQWGSIRAGVTFQQLLGSRGGNALQRGSACCAILAIFPLKINL